MIGSLDGSEEPETQRKTIDNIARPMRTKSFEYNQEHPNNEVIIKDIRRMSNGDIEIDEASINNLRNDYKQHLSARPAKSKQQSGTKQHPPQKSRSQFQQRGFQKSGRTHNLQK